MRDLCIQPGMTNYSQGDEQEHILTALAAIPQGRFLDVGAFNPKVFSNTRALYERGWSGVMLEPAPEPFLSLLREYGDNERVTLIAAALGFDHGLARLWVTADATSTTSQEHYEKWRDICKFEGSYLVPTITWADVLNQFGSFEFVNIDAEGNSAELFMALLNTGMRPRCICVEHDGREGVLAAAAGPCGYRLVFRNGENAVFAI